ncbi:PAS domain S-box protein [Variovorax sp. J22G73]|uniref:PAS domain S-box protein n=1 Tax=unclassified Variovorax TaxID=663243 RepID=UPI00257675C3|nr:MULTISPECIES: PAS domain S-box protein [unclassified Variovorax]MDM0009523.1 PAS domain S-box protein [Variovorax sp. J22R203]MDM0102031.1 PAS domain S-box protein [Variovorax sp. J22G73]
MNESTPDRAEQDAEGELDDAVPSFGYALLPVVGLAGAAGGLESLRAFLEGAAERSGMAFVVVLNLPTMRLEALVEQLRVWTHMHVVPVTGRQRLAADTVHVLPPGMSPRLSGNFVALGDPPGRARHLPADLFLRTLADSHGPHGTAVVLSGAGGDGALGIRRLKERGGLTIAQEPGETAEGGMVNAAIATGMVDWVLPPREMGERIAGYYRIEAQLRLPPEQAEEAGRPTGRNGDDGNDGEAALRDVLDFVRERTGRDFDDYKRATVLRRIGRRMQVNGTHDLRAYLDCLRTRPGEAGALVHDMLISVTNFFRDADSFAALEARVPALFRDKGPQDAVRVWVVACATGEEAYSIAMLLSEYARTLAHPPAIQVFATDLDEDAVRTARNGVYPLAAEADLSEERIRQFFVRDPRGWRVRRELREMVLFAVHDVLRDSPFSRIDLASCRNLLIYMSRSAQAHVLQTLHFALQPGAPLFLGVSESAGGQQALFSVADKAHRIYVHRRVPRASVPAPHRAPSGPRVPDARPALALIPHAAVAGPAAPATALPTLPTLRGGRTMTWAEMHLLLIDQLAPPSILVDADNEMLHISPAATGLLYFDGGEPTRNVLRAIVPDLKAELQTALHHARERNEPVEVAPVRVRHARGEWEVAIGVQPVQGFGSGFLVLLRHTDVGGAAASDTPDAARAAPDDAIVVRPRLQPEPVSEHLEREVDRLKARLRQTVEQYEVSTEELKAGNEELHAMNEELHAAAEELDTSREELQSINEEMITVNQELKSKVDDLGHANSDILNLMDATSIATVFLDRQLRVMRFTPSAAVIFNLMAGDTGRPLSDLVNGLDYPELAEDARAVLRELRPTEREVGDAKGSWFLARMRPYRTIEDVIAGVAITFVDITERKAEQEQLRQSQERFSAIVTQASVGVAQLRLDGEITFANPRYCALMGYRADEVVGLRALDMVHSADLAHMQALFSALAAYGEPFQAESRSVRKDGSVIWLHKSATVLTDDSGQPHAALVVCTDVSKRKFAEDALRESKERMRMVLENAVEYAIFSLDLARRVTSWNAGAERLLGYSEQEILGHPGDLIFTPEDRAADAPGHEQRTALAQGRAADERVHQRKDGSRFWASGALMPMHDGQGAVVGLVKVLRDQSEQRAAQQELEAGRAELLEVLRANEAARRALETADAAKDRFLAVLSHELRNPLASISASSEVLAPEQLAMPDQARAARVIRRQALAIKVMLNDLLDVSTLRQGRLAIKPERTSALAVVEAALEAVRPLIEHGRHVLELDLAEEEIALDADPTRLTQVLSNLLSNAAKYTPAQGRIVLSLHADARDAVFEVTDDGIGMDADTIETMFEMFVQSAHGHERAAGGLGIGLALARSIVEMHGGTVSGQSPGLGRGCRFTVRVPCARAHGHASAFAPAAFAAPAAPALAVERLAPALPQVPQRLLLADDNVDALWGMGQMLTLAGFSVETVHNGIDALRLAREQHPDAAVLDIGMPGLDGHEVARRIRAEPWGRDIVLIAATGWGQPADRAAALAAGFDEHVAKPVTAADLQRLLRAHEAGKRPASDSGR